jgi:hypothetical protein
VNFVNKTVHCCTVDPGQNGQTGKYRGKRTLPPVQIAARFGMMEFSTLFFYFTVAFMRTLALTSLLVVSLGIGSCAGIARTPPSLGDPIEVVVQKFGRPTGSYGDPGQPVLEYATGPMGQLTWMARFGPDGRLASFEQVLSAEGFGRIKVDKATRDDVLRTIGRPAEKSYLALRDMDVWSYRYKESGVWNSMMHVHFDRAGIVRQMMNGPDPMYEEKRFFRD